MDSHPKWNTWVLLGGSTLNWYRNAPTIYGLSIGHLGEYLGTIPLKDGPKKKSGGFRVGISKQVTDFQGDKSPLAAKSEKGGVFGAIFFQEFSGLLGEFILYFDEILF